MDPEETLRLAEEAFRLGDYDDALDHLNEYRSWREQGGFEPDDGDSRESDLRIAIGQKMQTKRSNPPYKPPASGNLPKHGKEMLKNVYTSARERGFGEEAAARQAWCAVKRYYYKRGNKWTKRKEPISPNEYPPGCGPPERNPKMPRKKNQGRHYESSEWVEFILDGFPESMEIDVEPEITPELQAEVDRFTAAVDKAVKECSKQFPSSQEIIPDDEEYHLIYQTLVGAGVGIRDGDWDHYYPNYERDSDWDPLIECYRNKLQRFADITGGGSLNEAFMDAVYAAEMPEDDTGFKKMKPKNVSQLKNKLLR